MFILLTIYVLGKQGFAFLKSKIGAALGAAMRRIAPAREVSQARYILGLVLLLVPLAEMWAMPYLTVALPDATAALREWDFVTDIMLIASFFVLGGEAWDKLRALVSRSARAVFPAPRTATAPQSAALHLLAAAILLIAGQVGFLVVRPLVMESASTDFAKALAGAFFVLLPGIAVVAAVVALGRAGSLAAHRAMPAVGLARHCIGLVLIGVPLVGGLIVDYAVGPYAPFEGRLKILLDLMLIGGTFVLGPDFWDKLRAFFDHRARAQLAPAG